MSIVFSKNKEKRARTSSGESNNSFVKNVTSRVSGLLPTTITKWFSSPSSSANGSGPAVDANDSSTEDEAPESPVTAQPPAKRMRFSPGAGYGTTDGNCVTNNIETIESSTAYTVQSPPGRTTFRRETNFVSTPIRSEESINDRTAIDMNATDRTSTDRTTSDRTTTDRTTTDREPSTSSTRTATSIGLSTSKKRKSLFGNQLQELSDASKKACVQTSNNTVRDPRQPSFKPTLLGSPFYAGRTTYGGAASTYINRPNISHRQTATVREAPSTCDNNMSTSARRILELLESYSSPLMDAKRIPHYTRPTRQELMKRHSESSTSSSLYNRNNSYRSQELHVPSIASVLWLKQRARLNESTNAARQLIASHSSSSPYPPAAKRDQSETDGGSSNLTTKVKSRLTRPNRGEANTMDSETIIPVELPKAVLQIDPNNLPNFNIPVSFKSSSLEKPTPSTPLCTTIFEPKTASTVEKSKSESITTSSIYNFAHPVRITSESPKPTSTPPKFTFGSPERSIDKPLAGDKSSEPFNLLGASKENRKESEKKTEASAVDWNCPDCWVKNKSDAAQCVCCGRKQSAAAVAKPAKCSLCKLADTQANSDKCVNCIKVQANNISKPLKANTSAKWSCKDCWVSNDDSATKCVCCGAADPRKGTTQTAPATKPEAGGMCSKCFSTKNSDGTCSICAAAKPDASFTFVLKSQANKWECEHCLVRNDSDKTKCVCCETERSGKPKQPEKMQFNFGTVNTTFKFGIDPKVQEANLSKAAEKPAETKDKIEESETNNNVLSKAPPTFSFGIPAKKSEDQPDAPKDKVAEAPKATFSFGLPSQNAVTSTPAPMFGMPNKLTEARKEADKKEPEKKAHEVKENLREKAPEPAKPPVMAFGPASALADKLSTATPGTAFTLNKDASNTLTLPTTSAPAVTFSAPTSSVEKPATGLFGTISTTTPATTISFAPPAAAAALSMFQKTDEKLVNSPFQKNDAPATSAVSPFQKSEAPADTPAPATKATPMFSFGNSQTTTGDKPSFNFTFSSSTKSDMFKPPTFAATDSSTTVNKFTLGATATENALATANHLGGIGGSPLAANSLTNSLTSGNGLSVNPLAAAANPLSSGNGLPASGALSSGTTNIFGSAVKENAWSPPNNSATSLFTGNATTNTAPKPFSFGTSTPFSANPAPAFGSSSTQSSTPAFGSTLTTSTPAFGTGTQPVAVATFGAAQSTPTPAFGSAQPSSNIFGMANQNSQPSIFSPPNPSSAGMFGSPQQPATGGMQPPSMDMFGRPNVGAAPTFGTPNPSLPTFEAPSLPAQAPSFSFGTPQTSFVFGGQQQQPAAGIGGQTGVYSFGQGGGQAQVQFSMGSAPNANVRRVRRAVRRSSQR